MERKYQEIMSDNKIIDSQNQRYTVMLFRIL